MARGDSLPSLRKGQPNGTGRPQTGGGHGDRHAQEIQEALENSRKLMKENILRTAMIKEELVDEEQTMLESLQIEKEIGYTQTTAKNLIKELQKQYVREENLFRCAVFLYIIILIFVVVRRFYFPGMELFTLIGWLTTFFTSNSDNNSKLSNSNHDLEEL